MRHSGPSNDDRLRAGLAWSAAIHSAGYGPTSGITLSGSSTVGSSHTASASGFRMTGIRSWTGLHRSFGVVVRMATVNTFPSGPGHTSQMPANPNGDLSFRWNQTGIFFLLTTAHS